MTNILKIKKIRTSKIRGYDKPIQKSVERGIDFKEYVNRVEKKAYELYEKRGCENGRDWEDWFEAKRIIEDELCSNK